MLSKLADALNEMAWENQRLRLERIQAKAKYDQLQKAYNRLLAAYELNRAAIVGLEKQIILLKSAMQDKHDVIVALQEHVDVAQRALSETQTALNLCRQELHEVQHQLRFKHHQFMQFEPFLNTIAEHDQQRLIVFEQTVKDSNHLKSQLASAHAHLAIYEQSRLHQMVAGYVKWRRKGRPPAPEPIEETNVPSRFAAFDAVDAARRQLHDVVNSFASVQMMDVHCIDAVCRMAAGVLTRRLPQSLLAEDILPDVSSVKQPADVQPFSTKPAAYAILLPARLYKMFSYCCAEDEISSSPLMRIFGVADRIDTVHRKRRIEQHIVLSGGQTIPLLNGYSIHFPFFCDIDQLSCIELAFSTSAQFCPGYIQMTVWEDSRLTVLVRQVWVQAALLADNDFTAFHFTPIDGSQNCAFFVSLELIYGSDQIFPGLWQGVMGRPEQVEYLRWQQKYEAICHQSRSQQLADSALEDNGPLISLLMPVYNADLHWLKIAIGSVHQQTYSRWQLCIANDGSADARIDAFLRAYADADSRIRFISLKHNQGISAATNQALALADGDFVAFMDQDDKLTPDALAEVAKWVHEHPDADMIYSDEDKITVEGRRIDPFFKTDWAPDSFLSHMFTGHLCVCRTALIRDIGGLRSAFDGSQDYDLVLRLSEKTRRIDHIPRILYHWRVLAGSAALDIKQKTYAMGAALRAIDQALQRRGIAATVEAGQLTGSYRVKRHLKGSPDVSLVLAIDDHVRISDRLIEKWLAQHTPGRLQIIIVHTRKAVIARKKRGFSNYGGRVEACCYEKRYHPAAMLDAGAQKASGDFVLFLDHQLAPLGRGALSAMVEHAQRRRVGAVGGCIIHRSGVFQHAGIILGLDGAAGFSHWGIDAASPGYFGQPHIIANVSAVSMSCMMMQRDRFLKFRQQSMPTLQLPGIDIDLCLRLQAHGYIIIYTSFARFESRKAIGRPPLLNRKTVATLQQAWGARLLHDPYYNPNLSTKSPGFTLNVPNERRCHEHESI